MRKFVLVGIISILIALDMGSKYYFEQLLISKEYVPILGEFLGFKLSYNSGIAFSLPIKGLFLNLMTLILLFGIFVYYLRDEYKKNSPLLDIGYALIFSGAISHAYERIFVGHVIDFIAVKYFAILNFADIFITVGAFLLVFAYGIHSRARS